MLCWHGFLLVLQAGSALLDLGVKPKDRVGVIGANCPEWMLTMQGCNRTRCATATAAAAAVLVARGSSRCSGGSTARICLQPGDSNSSSS